MKVLVTGGTGFIGSPVVGLFKQQRDADNLLTIIGDGRQRRDFTHISDAVMANLFADKELRWTPQTILEDYLRG